MNVKKWILLGSAFALTAALAVNLFAAGKTPERIAMEAFMRQKLTYSQGILEGLALEKFDLISKNALRMRDMSQSNMWFTVRHPDYMANTTNYQKSMTALYMAAVDKDLDAATEAYAKVARNCVECHRIVRLDQHRMDASRARP